MREQNVSTTGSKNRHNNAPESENNLAAAIAVVSLIILLFCVLR